MRLSVLQGDKGYNPEEARKYKVFLDGAEQHYGIIADSEQGFVYRYKTDSRGLIMRKGGKSMTETKYGVVTFELKWNTQ